MPEKQTYRRLKYICTENGQLLLNAGLAAGALMVALVAQYGFDKFPCELCILQRWPYAAIVLFAGAALFAPDAWRKPILWLIVVLLAGEVALAFYHVGVEQQWWQSATGCGSNQARDMSLEELRAAILAAPTVDCRDAGWQFLGVSMATWNTVYAFTLACLNVILLRRRSKEQADATHTQA